MKNLSFALAVILILSYGCSQINKTAKQSTINLNFIGDIPPEIEYTLPIDNRFYNWFKKIENCPSTGKMSIPIDIDQPNFIRLVVNDRPRSIYKKYLIEPGKEYHFDVIRNDSINVIEVKDASAELQSFYQSFKEPGHIQLATRKYVDSTWQKLALLEEDMNIDIARVDSFMNSSDVHPEVIELLKIDRRTFYMALKGTLAFLKSFEKGGVNERDQEVWNAVYPENKLDENLSRSTYFGYLMDDFRDFHILKDLNGTYDSMNIMYDNGTLNDYEFNMISEIVDGELKEFMQASFVQGKLVNHKYKTELIGLVENYRKNYSNSSYSVYQDQYYSEIMKYAETDFTNWPEGVKFLRFEKDQISVPGIFDKIKGEKYLVDIWATWCGPCLRDFKYNDKLKNVLADLGYKKLYISIDSEQDTQKWEEAIKYHDLKGRHVIVDEPTRKKLIDFLSPTGSMGIPRYLITNELGDIINDQASRPFEMDKLIAELKSVGN